MGTPARSRYLPRSQTNRVGIVFELVELSQVESLQDFRVLGCGKMYLSRGTVEYLPLFAYIVNFPIPISWHHEIVCATFSSITASGTS